MTIAISILLALVVSLAVMGVLLTVKTPHYRANASSVSTLLEWVLLGQASENQWRIFCEIPIRHCSELEDIRQRCVAIDDAHFVGECRRGCMLDKEGQLALQDVLKDVKQLS